MKKQKQVIIFDFDGTIADTFETVLNIFNQFAAEFGFRKVDLKESQQLKNKTAKELLQEFHIPLFKVPFIIKNVRQELEKKIETVKLFKEIDVSIRILKKRGYILGILTSNHETNVHMFLKNSHFEIFDFVYSGSSIFGKSKIFKKIMQEKKLTANQIIYVGDETRDIEAAKKVGIKIIAVTWGYNTKNILAQGHPDFIIDSPSELLTILK